MKNTVVSFMDAKHGQFVAQPAASASDSHGFYRTFGKRHMDIVFVLLSLPVMVPVILILALLVVRDGKSPFFGHTRIGRNGRAFRCWKIRSMVADAEDRLKTHLAENADARAEWDANFKLDDDPRITRLGRFLRKSSLDELPQLWNILIGEMSIVGPRPVTAAELDLYGTAVDDYTAMRPGLTGLWQVSGRNDISYAARVQMDVTYVQTCNPALDAAIVMRTALAVTQRTGK
ncbi:Sugar transferase involved in LPS biosynthesis (colanic, teichoic acid) [Loktanella fryxellensis]|uniref:Sugar transferase involved in LPS biosynthesis (Colanic, teichoic acid) n=1 Tax=Loktanella fryxellensis TaxID=245187 RepID=A0A1H8H721_9RHOB|nr:sugar transferase [Loktanella fryxellensis]SEN51338.1 Sugar transferase involved in LPS biosynthesis (colanic, teichoic acid) [Loktanella fryxellensis]